MNNTIEFDARCLIALTVFAILGIAIIVAFLRYQSDEISKPVGLLAGLFGTVIGSIGTFYFNEKKYDTAKVQASDYKELACAMLKSDPSLNDATRDNVTVWCKE